ncbi:cobalamin biosynthesis protein [Halorussus lipolyticus]|uniref:cobalamin biosynthesis protein n=1 Tax=Halorussus lipolyticus TaxID=3034024 RepID=UPI0023E8E74D|nr:cobalamin biosynthesis protein [Halorussus sp. DT80]
MTSDPAVGESAPDDMLAGHPELAYFWGRVAGDGDVTRDEIRVVAGDETAAERLAAIAGAEQVEHRIAEREYAHDTAITRTEDEYTVQVIGSTLADRASAALGLPVADHPGGYRFDAFADYDRQLIRGLLEGCGTICFKRSSGTVGISFVHDDRNLVETVQSIVEMAEVEAPTGELAESSSGRYWFGVEDDAGGRFGEWLYRDTDESGLFAPNRRRKLRRSLEQAEQAEK